MEKFGIFELLDALSAITDTAPNPPAEEEPAPAEPKRMPDEAFAAPSYGSGDTVPPPAGENALGSFLARHDEISKRAKK